jgi:hypothetical protein
LNEVSEVSDISQQIMFVKSMRDGWIADNVSWNDGLLPVRITKCAFGIYSFEVGVLVRLSRSGMSRVGNGNHSSPIFLARLDAPPCFILVVCFFCSAGSISKGTGSLTESSRFVKTAIARRALAFSDSYLNIVFGLRLNNC